MKDLKCGLVNCKHNKGYSCNAKRIEVDKKTDCKTYEQDEKRVSLFEAGSDFTPVSYSVDTKVGCDAECLFQKEHKCIANGITVMNGEKSVAECLTFIKK